MKIEMICLLDNRYSIPIFKFCDNSEELIFRQDKVQHWANCCMCKIMYVHFLLISHALKLPCKTFSIEVVTVYCPTL